MEINGCLSDCSATDLLRFLEKTQATGCLTLWPQGQRPLSNRRSYQIWIERGFLVAALKPSSTNGLFWLIHQQGWVSYNALLQLAKCLPAGQPIGVYLRAQGVLKTQQIQQIFQAQIADSMKLLTQENLQFQFHSDANLPLSQMTGLRIPLCDAMHTLRRVPVAVG